MTEFRVPVGAPRSPSGRPASCHPYPPRMGLTPARGTGPQGRGVCEESLSSSSRPVFNCPNIGQAFSTPPDLGWAFWLQRWADWVQLIHPPQKRDREHAGDTELGGRTAVQWKGPLPGGTARRSRAGPGGSLSKGWGCGRGHGEGVEGRGHERMCFYPVSLPLSLTAALSETCTNLSASSLRVRNQVRGWTGGHI